MKQALILLFAIISVHAFGQCNKIPYTIDFGIVEKSDGQVYLVVALDLAEGSHFVSPYSSDSFSGRFGVHFADNEFLATDGSFTETPQSVQIYDPHPFVKGVVNWVHVDTRYEYPIQLNASRDIEVLGEVHFTIEPRCTFEKIPFIIKRIDGKLVAERFQC